MFEQKGFRFFTSMAPGEQSYIVTPALTAFPLRRAGDLSLLLDGRFTSPGTFEVGPGPDSLLCDNRAKTCVAGRDWARCLFRLPGLGRNLRDVGGVQLRSVARGRVSLLFPNGAHLRWISAPGLSLLTGKKCGLKILHPGGHLAAPRAPLLLQGVRLVRSEPPDGPTAEGAAPAAAGTGAAGAPPGAIVPGSALESLLQRSELPVPGLEVRPSARRTSRFPSLTQPQVVERLHISQPPCYASSSAWPSESGGFRPRTPRSWSPPTTYSNPRSAGGRSLALVLWDRVPSTLRCPWASAGTWTCFPSFHVPWADS